ncbi:EAL domain-containing protein [Sulfurimonas sp. HSL3-7]|uniref:putative bifunctional diguanylate cyclase/phosphodiesterase n=1 Tax=Sulfonitrofixus jiaomeiensis TaxID=3131938 RepID=UPI0031F77D6C
MKTTESYTFLRKQILLLIALSLFPGLGYIFLGWINGIAEPALFWYILTLLVSFWGYRLYKAYIPNRMNANETKQWYNKVSIFFLVIFSLWTLIFVLYVTEERGHLNYIAIFTQIGASVVASTLLTSDKRLFALTLMFLLIPLSIYFSLIGELYGYILALFSLILLGVLYYSSYTSYLLLETSSFQAAHDHLTGLYNRRYFIDCLTQKVKNLYHSQRYSFMMLIDLDHFKTINDSLGHDVGDKLLKVVASRMERLIAADQIVARLGGDEFVIVSQEFESREEALNEAMFLAKALLTLLKEPYIIDLHHLYISASIGVEVVDKSSSSANRLIKEADIAMYEVKAQGRDGVIIFNDALAKRIEMHLQIERQLHFALQHGEITLLYQPQFNAQEKVIGCEVLSRWHNDTLGTIPPDKFIPIAEKTGLIVELGTYILEESFKTLASWTKKGMHLEQFSINISVRQLFHSTFIEGVERLTDTYLTPELTGKLVFEITETVLVEDIDRVVAIMKRLSLRNIHFSMDDFGTGYSSLSYLSAMPISELKIDRSFISNLYKESSDQAMVVTILNMAKIFKLKVVAEGVETAQQLSFLQQNHCHLFQGYYFSKPLSDEAFTDFYMARTSQETEEMLNQRNI